MGDPQGTSGQCSCRIVPRTSICGSIVVPEAERICSPRRTAPKEEQPRKAKCSPASVISPLPANQLPGGLRGYPNQAAIGDVAVDLRLIPNGELSHGRRGLSA